MSTQPKSGRPVAWEREAPRARLGRAVGALRRLRRAPVAAVRSRRADRADRAAGRVPPLDRRRTVETIVLIPSGPGRWEQLADSLDALLASDGGASQVIVVDDATTDTRESVIRGRFPEVEVVRKPVPSGGPPSTWPVYRYGLLHALRHYDFDRLVKMDSDALVTAPRFSAAVGERLAGTPGVGLAGWWGTRCDGARADPEYHALVLDGELRADAGLRRAAEAALAEGWRYGEIVHGGTQVVTRIALDAVREAGFLDWRRSWDSRTSDDLILTMFVKAAGFDLLQLGGPDGVFAIGNDHLPLPKEQVADGPWLAAHSTKRGVAGENEAELRAYFRARRADWVR